MLIFFASSLEFPSVFLLRALVITHKCIYLIYIHGIYSWKPEGGEYLRKILFVSRIMTITVAALLFVRWHQVYTVRYVSSNRMLYKHRAQHVVKVNYNDGT